MITYIATFYTHYDAVCFAKRLRTLSIPAKPMPVPRRLSSSCGTCVRFELPSGSDPTPYQVDEVEQLIRLGEQGDCIVWDNRR